VRKNILCAFETVGRDMVKVGCLRLSYLRG
jgi:hypothetical protein